MSGGKPEIGKRVWQGRKESRDAAPAFETEQLLVGSHRVPVGPGSLQAMGQVAQNLEMWTRRPSEVVSGQLVWWDYIGNWLEGQVTKGSTLSHREREGPQHGQPMEGAESLNVATKRHNLQ